MHWLAAVIFFLLSPGVLLTIPAGSKGVWMSCQTSLAAAAVHAVLFVIVSHYVWKYARSQGFEGFEEEKKKEGWEEMKKKEGWEEMKKKEAFYNRR